MPDTEKYDNLLNKIDNGLMTSELITKAITNQNVDTIKKNFELLNSFLEVHQNEQQKLPYHLNLLDQVKANENAHTRIFAELLRQKDNNTHEILISFYRYLSKKKSVFNLPETIKPRITVEKGRIDLLICDNGFAIIVENKIHGAIDRESQIAKYIKKVIGMGYSKPNIYIVYLTRDATKEIDSKSWFSEESNNLKQEYADRFFHLTYRLDILPWLREQVLPYCRLKDIYLRSAIEQYIDHLEGIFNLRTIQAQMKQKIQNHLKDALGLKASNPYETNREVIKNKLEELELIKTHLSSMLIDETLQRFSQWSNQLKIDFAPHEVIMNIKETEVYKNLAVKLSYRGHHFSVLIEFCEDDDEIYIGIGRHYGSEEKINIIHEELISQLNKSHYVLDDANWWYMWRYTNFTNGYVDLKHLIIEVMDILGKME